MKRFTTTDVPALERMIVAYELLTQAEQDVLENGRNITIHAKTGEYQQTSPSVGQIKTFSDQVRKWFAEFGLTPSGRGAKHHQASGGSEALDEFNKEI